MKKRTIAFIAAIAVAVCSQNASGAYVNSVEALSNDGGLYEYSRYVEDISLLPVSFKIGERGYKGFGKNFRLNKHVNYAHDGKVEDTFYLTEIYSGLDVTVCLVGYPDCNALEWTMYFANNTGKNSPVLSDIGAADMSFTGDDPVLKGIYGDVGGNYASYEYDLKKEPVTFDSVSGRPSDGTFPYYNLEYGDGGTVMAIGWPGTWKASFNYVGDGVTEYYATANVGFSSYLKPGETVRTALAAFVNYKGRSEDVATNAWRKWYIKYNMPTERDGSRLKPIKTLATFNDYSTTGSIGHDISVYETTESVLTGLKNAYDHGVDFDYFWMDAGWYDNVDGSSITSHANWRTIGTWEVDKNYFPNGLSEIDDYLEMHNDKYLLWFEPEWNLLHDNALFMRNTGFKTEWFLPGGGSSAIQLVNFANNECYSWMLERLSKVIRESGVEYFRDDFNNDPAPAWRFGDFAEGDDRSGITENLYVQNHLRLWKELKERFPDLLIDSCSSGGRRNDLETMRLAVPLHRTDMDYNSPNMRLSMSRNLFKWLPYFGSPAFLSNNPDVVSKYLMRAAYGGDIKLTFAWSSMSEAAYDTLLDCLEEYDIVKQYIYGDYYALTDGVSVEESDAWTAWEFFDADKDSGIVEVFRRDGSTESECVLKIKGVDDWHRYELYDFDGVQGKTTVSGTDLKRGVTIRLERETSALLMIRPV